jgi:hypothetical protein
VDRPWTRSRLIGLALIAGVAAACGGPTPSASPPPAASSSAVAPTGSPAGSPAASQDPLAVYAAIAADVEGIRGLRPSADVTPVLVDEARLRADITDEFDRSHPAARIAAREHLLEGLGLLAPGASWRTANLDLLAGQVAGYYDPERDQLFVVSRTGAIGPTQRATYAHEFTHQLQDQRFDLGTLDLDAPDQTDRSLARLALIEGDASAVQSRWIQARLTPQELTQMLIDASDPKAVEALQNAPSILRATSIFPYQDGLALAMRLVAEGGFARVDSAYANPPDSTEQVLHPEKYLADEKPIDVAFPGDGLLQGLGKGWTVEAQDTLGELFLRTWIASAGQSASGVATSAAAGWGGDRVGVLRGPGDAGAIVLVSTWDTAADAGEFADAAARACGDYGIDADVVHAAGTRHVAIAATPDDAARRTLGIELRGLGVVTIP